MTWQVRWLNSRGSLWSCVPVLFLLLSGFGWFRDLQIGDIYFKLLPSSPTVNEAPRKLSGNPPILSHISSSLPSESVTATPVNLMLEMIPLLCSVPLVQVAVGLTWDMEGLNHHLTYWYTSPAIGAAAC